MLFSRSLINHSLYILFSCSAALAHATLQEKLHIFGILGCSLCVVGWITIVLHPPQEQQIESVADVWDLATEPGAGFIPTQKFIQYL
ncbi:hypothetical protein MLD38_034596 [Melastoma candidum]|uniref:Uncharacterized protein n=1 Tax=Melastoma candidum TaxID=119954 RepID=A0ACB9MCI6_9MYRT|nr:hypothetical protein MLD38_034596 [Melastoma candidum]